MDGSNLSERDLGRVLTRAELPRILSTICATPRQRRCSAAAFTPSWFSEMLDHADVRITLDLYGHVPPTMHREAAAVYDKVLEGGR